MRKIIGVLLWIGALLDSVWGATLIPNGQQQFLDGNGNPYANGKVYFYSNYPTCTVLKNTWQDSGGSVLNTNPVVLNAAGRATIFGSGAYCQVLKDQNGNTVWTKYTADTSSTSGLSWGGTSGGTANAQTITSSSFTGIDGQTIYFVAGATNTGNTTLAVNGGTTVGLVKPTSNGVAFLTGGEIVAGNLVGVTYVQGTGQFQLVTNDLTGFGATTTIAGSATTNLNAAASHVVSISGSGTNITSFGSGGANAQINSIYYVTFSGSNTITYNATSMITPNGQNISTFTGDSLVAVYLGGSNWQILAYQSANGPVQINAQTGTTYSVQASDWGKLLTFSNAATTNVTVPQATGAYGAGFSFRVQNVGAQPVVLTPTTSTIAGATSVSVNPGTGWMVVSDGTNWQIHGVTKGLVQMPIYTNSGSVSVVNFATISPDAKKVVIGFHNVGGTGDLRSRLMVAGSAVTSGYLGGYSSGSNAIVTANYTAGCEVINNLATGPISGTMTLVNLGGNIWAGSGVFNNNASSYTFSSCSISLAGVITGVSVTATTITSGSIGVVYE